MEADGWREVDGTVARAMYEAIRGVAQRHGLSPAQAVPLARHVLDVMARSYGLTGGRVIPVADDPPPPP